LAFERIRQVEEELKQIKLFCLDVELAKERRLIAMAQSVSLD
jgi:hypothetical protein